MPPALRPPSPPPGCALPEGARERGTARDSALAEVLAAAARGEGAILAPLAGYTDAPFRHLCRAMGAILAVTELVSAEGIVRGRGRSMRRTLGIAEPYPGESVVLQVFGADADVIADAGCILAERYRPVSIDLNMGCAVPKVVRRGEGAALLKDPVRAARIVRALVRTVPVEVTVKMRSGFDRVVAPEIAKRLEAEGASAVAVHGRLAVQGFRGKADWDVVAAVRDAVEIPVIGCGDVDSAGSFRDRVRLGVGVMIGRAARGNPWIFREVRGGDPPAGPAERVAMILMHAQLAERWSTKRTALLRLRAHMGGYLKGFPGARALRDEAIRAARLEDLREILSRRPPTDRVPRDPAGLP